MAIINVCRECGARVIEYCGNHPKAIVESAFAPEKVRTVRFTPYRKGMGPVFTLHLYDVHKWDSVGRTAIGYRLVCNGVRLFDCQEPSNAVYAHCAVDSDDAVKTVMGWLTLRPGDTDSEFFENYTTAQLDFAHSHADNLHGEVIARFGEDD